jgi:hypothetical protein
MVCSRLKSENPILGRSNTIKRKPSLFVSASKKAPADRQIQRKRAAEFSCGKKTSGNIYKSPFKQTNLSIFFV